MPSNAGPSQTFPVLQFPTAHVCIIHSRLSKRKPKKAKLVVLHNIYWKELNKAENFEPRSLADFYNVDSLEISRLENGASWDDVEEAVKTAISEGLPSVSVSGNLHRRSLRKWFSGKARMEILAASEKQRDEWAQDIRARVAPWSLLRQRMKALAAHIQSSFSGDDAIEDLTNRFEKVLGKDVVQDLTGPAVPSGVVNPIVASQPFSRPQNETKDTWINKLSTLRDRMQKLDWVDSLYAQSSAGVETAATFMGLVEKAEKVAETADFVADVSKCVAGASTVFQLIVLSARLVSKFAEANRGRAVLPLTLDRIIRLLRYVLRSLVQLLNPTSNVDILHEDFAFDVLRQTVDTVSLIEAQLLRGWGSRFLHSKVVKEVESRVKDLDHRVVTLTNTSNTYINSKKIAQLKMEVSNSVDERHHRPPKCSPYFVGRTTELEKLKGILNKYGSAAIAQFGGVGKTELMSAFAEHVESEGDVPGGVYWITVDGEVGNVIESLACFVDKFRTRKMMEKERRDVKQVLAELERCLSRRNGRWLLCLDNADDAELSGLLDAVCAIGKPSDKNGWVLVTSRRGEPKLWRRMKSEQKIVLKPISAGDAMILLWREIKVLEAKKVSDEAVMDEINDMEETKTVEYHALRELCGYEGEFSLGGLPLALVQAGTYIGRYHCSFSEYLNLLKEANEKRKLVNLLEKASEISLVNDAQRSILTTWKISVERLSSEAYEVLRSMSMLGPGPIPAEVVRGILKRAGDGNESVEWMFRNVLIKELVHGSSLVYSEKGDALEIHRLVRRFVLADMERGSEVWNKTFRRALLAMHTRICEVLAREDKPFQQLPDVFGDRHRQYLPHLLAIIDNFVGPSSRTQEAQLVSELEDIACYTSTALTFFGIVHENVDIWRSVLAVLQSLDGKHEIKIRVADAKRCLGSALYDQGKWSEAELMFEQTLQMYKDIYGHDCNHRDIAKSLNKLGMMYLSQGKWSRAESVLEESMRIFKYIHGHGSNHKDIANSLNCLGLMYEQQGKWNEAEFVFEESLRMYKDIHGHDSNHSDIANSLNNLGLVYEKQGKWNRAELIFKECLRMYKDIHGHDRNHSVIANSLHNLGTVYFNRGKWSEAQLMFEESLKMFKEILGLDNNHSAIANSLNSLGLVYFHQGKWNEAEPMLEDSLRMKREIYGGDKNHSLIAASLNNLGLVYLNQGKWSEAESMFGQSLRMYKDIHGHDSNHSDIAMSLSNLGSVYLNQGKLSESEAICKECIRMYKDIHGHDSKHSDIARSLNNLGMVYEKRGKWSEAELIHEESLRMYKDIHGHDSKHIDIALSWNNLGSMYERQGKWSEAELMYGRSMRMYKDIHGHDSKHIDIAMMLNNFGSVYEKQGKWSKAESMHKASLRMNKDIYGHETNHIDIARSLNNLGSVYEKQLKWSEAESMHKESLRMRKVVHGHNSIHSEIATSLNNLGLVYLNQGRWNEAESLLKESLQMNKDIHGHNSNHGDIAKTLNNLGAIYENQGKLKEAEKMHEQCLRMYKNIYGDGSNHSDIAKSLNNLGTVFLKQVKLCEAELMFEESLRMFREIHGYESIHNDIAVSLNNLGMLRLNQEKWNEAESLLKDSLRMYKDIYGHDCNQSFIATLLNNLGFVCFNQRKLSESESMFEDCLRMYKNIHGHESNHSDISLALENLVAIREVREAVEDGVTC